MRGFLPLLLLLAAGCSREGAYRAVVEEQIAAWEETAGVLSGVKDAESMQAAAQKLQARQGHYADVAARAKRLGPPSPEIQESLRLEMDRLQIALRRVQRETLRIKELPGGKAFLEE